MHRAASSAASMCLCLCLFAAPSRGAFLDLSPSAEALYRRAPAVGIEPERHTLEPASFGLAVFTTRESADAGVLLFDLSGLAGQEVAYAGLTVHVLRTQANASLPIALGVDGFADGDGVIEVDEVRPGAPATTLGEFPELLANQLDVDIPIALDVTEFVRSLSAGSDPFAGFRLGPFIGGNQGFILAGSADALGRGPVLRVVFAVPEPGSLGMAGMALAMAGGWARRRAG